MQVKQPLSSIYPNMGYWMLLFVLGVFGGFYFTYFSKISNSIPSIVHVHFAFMSIWIGMAIIQPLLIKYNKISLHRKIGKVSYLILPFVILTSFLMMRHSYQNQLASLTENIALGNETMSINEGLILLGSFQAIGFVYLIWLSTFFSLAIINRKTPSIHARYMVAAVLTFIGPTLDRFLFFWLDFAYIFPGVGIEYASFLLIDILLLFLIIVDLKKKRNIYPLVISLSIYIIFQALYTLIQKTEPYSKLVNFLLD
jgi:hypothetical protein